MNRYGARLSRVVPNDRHVSVEYRTHLNDRRMEMRLFNEEGLKKLEEGYEDWKENKAKGIA